MIYSDGTNVVDTAFTDLSSDYSPQLSANLDANGNNIAIDTATGIIDENGNFQFNSEIGEITETFIQIQDKSATLFLDPKTSDYFIYFQLINTIKT